MTSPRFLVTLPTLGTDPGPFRQTEGLPGELLSISFK